MLEDVLAELDPRIKEAVGMDLLRSAHLFSDAQEVRRFIGSTRYIDMVTPEVLEKVNPSKKIFIGRDPFRRPFVCVLYTVDGAKKRVTTLFQRYTHRPRPWCSGYSGFDSYRLCDTLVRDEDVADIAQLFVKGSFERDGSVLSV